MPIEIKMKNKEKEVICKFSKKLLSESSLLVIQFQSPFIRIILNEFIIQCFIDSILQTYWRFELCLKNR